MNINWYPGHMFKATKEIESRLKMVDLIIELIDSRAPYSSRNEEIRRLSAHKLTLVLATKFDLADPIVSSEWFSYFKKNNDIIYKTNLTKNNIQKEIVSLIEDLLKPKRARDQKRGINTRVSRVLVCGVPNVGKSTLINRLANRKSAKVENRAGVTRAQQLIKATDTIELYDTPGILWPKLNTEQIGINLALTGAIRDDILPLFDLANSLHAYLHKHYYQLLINRYGCESINFSEFLANLCNQRKLIKLKGEADLERAVVMFIKEFRDGLIGKITLESVHELNEQVIL